MDYNFSMLKITALILFLIFTLVFSLKLYFHYVYYPNHPVKYEFYHEKKIKVEDSKLYINPPSDGCIKNCIGKDKIEGCKQYSGKWDVCEVTCYGFVYNSCSSSKIQLIWAVITRWGLL